MKSKSKNRSEKQTTTGDTVTPMATAAALDGYIWMFRRLVMSTPVRERAALHNA